MADKVFCFFGIIRIVDRLPRNAQKPLKPEVLAPKQALPVVRFFGAVDFCVQHVFFNKCANFQNFFMK